MDAADISQQKEELFAKANLYKSKKEVTHTQPTGFCLFCGESVDVNRRWCDAECRDDWVTENEA